MVFCKTMDGFLQGLISSSMDYQSSLVPSSSRNSVAFSHRWRQVWSQLRTMSDRGPSVGYQTILLLL
ncbi:hypothetical protein Y032_0002g981 [Ancylostoma ceylanicum]|nr:hypothetical protein Y032_0002g981 [Ancylostoma ceylanicum]